MWVGYAWRKQGSIVKRVIPYRETTIRKTKVKMERLCKNIKMIGLEIRWREAAEDRNR